MNSELDRVLEEAARETLADVAGSYPPPVSAIQRRSGRKAKIRWIATGALAAVLVAGSVAAVLAVANSGSTSPALSASSPAFSTSREKNSEFSPDDSPPTGSAAECPITVPTGDVRAPQYQGESIDVPDGFEWIGGPELATYIPAGGAVWDDLPKSGTRLTQKVFLWAEGYSWTEEPVPSLDIEIENVGDADEDPPPITNASNGFREDSGSFMVVGVDVAPGCWSMSFSYDGAELVFVVDVRE